MRQLRISKAEAVEQFRRMVFNVVSRNQDDHTKNISFLMDVDGKWSLSPAYDVIYAHNPGGIWTSSHQMTINGKRDNFSFDDLLAVGRSIQLPKTKEIIHQVVEAVSQWPKYASMAGINNYVIEAIGKTHRLSIEKDQSTCS